jgi:hypothetical protein
MGSCSSNGFLGPAPPAVRHDGQAHQKGEKADFVDAVHHAKVQPRFGVLLEEVEGIEVKEKLLEKHGRGESG